MEFLAEIHSKIVHFPIAFLFIYPLLEFLYLITKKEFYNKSVLLFLVIGVTGALISVLSGNQAFEVLSKQSNINLYLFNEHQYYANITVWLFSALLVARFYLHIKKKLTKVVLVILLMIGLLGSYFVFQTGMYGGKLGKTVMQINTD